jgi:hypothetical protein
MTVLTRAYEKALIDRSKEALDILSSIAVFHRGYEFPTWIIPRYKMELLERFFMFVACSVMEDTGPIVELWEEEERDVIVGLITQDYMTRYGPHFPPLVRRLFHMFRRGERTWTGFDATPSYPWNDDHDPSQRQLIVRLGYVWIDTEYSYQMVGNKEVKKEYRDHRRRMGFGS